MPNREQTRRDTSSQGLVCQTNTDGDSVVLWIKRACAIFYLLMQYLRSPAKHQTEGIATMTIKDIRHSEQLFRALIEHNSDAIALLTREGTVIYASPSTELITGYTPEEFVGINA